MIALEGAAAIDFGAQRRTDSPRNLTEQTTREDLAVKQLIGTEIEFILITTKLLFKNNVITYFSVTLWYSFC